MIEKYEITSIDSIVCLPGEGLYRAVINSDTDLTELLPYINGFIPDARYMPKIHWLRFPFRGYPVRDASVWQAAIKGREILIAKFNDRTQAADVTRELVEFLNHIEASKATITPSIKEWAPPKVMDILKLLPGTNCGKCGCLSCMAFAAKLADQQAETGMCPEISKDSEEYRRIKEMTGG